MGKGPARIFNADGPLYDLKPWAGIQKPLYQAKEGSSMEKLFWAQYTGTEHPMPLSDQLKQLVELHKAAEHAMKGLIVQLWHGEALLGSYFGLVR